MNFNFSEIASENFGRVQEGNLSAMIKVGGTTYINIKDVCAGVVTQQALYLVIFLFSLNMATFLFWKFLPVLEFDLWGRHFTAAYIINVINVSTLIFLFVIIYNGI